jgi:hypothetical protein
MMKASFFAGLAAGALYLSVAGGSHAQEPALELEISGERLDFRTATGITLGDLWQTIVVYVDEHQCGIVDVSSMAPRTAAGNIAVRTGQGLDASPECMKQDGVVHFINGRGDALFVRFVVRDSPLLLSNLAPVPPQSPTDAGPPFVATIQPAPTQAAAMTATAQPSSPAIRPPDTGDAGLAEQRGGSLTYTAAGLSFVSMALGVLIWSRRRCPR